MEKFINIPKKDLKNQLFEAGFVGSIFTTCLMLLFTMSTQIPKYELYGHFVLLLILSGITYYKFYQLKTWYNEEI